MKKGILIIVLLSGVLWASAAFAVTDTVSVTATIAVGTSSVNIVENVIAFGTVTPSQADHRFTAGPMTVEYFAASSPWTLRAFCPTGEAGLKGADGAIVTMKLWNANYGGTGNPPDPEIGANWTGNNAVWARIPAANEQTADPLTWRRLAFTGAELPSPFVNYLAIDASGIKAQAYTTTLTVELINQ